MNRESQEGMSRNTPKVVGYALAGALEEGRALLERRNMGDRKEEKLGVTCIILLRLRKAKESRRGLGRRGGKCRISEMLNLAPRNRGGG